MSFDKQRLYELLPAIYRIRDADQSESLRGLLSVIAEQIAVLQESLDQLYDDQFIETCAEWVAAYIGDLIGYRLLHGVVPEISSPRAEVAHTIAYRRRKGTAAVLEQLARDVTGWNARVVEFFQLLATTQYVNHIRSDNWYAPDLRKWELLERLNTPFERVAHTAEVRRIATRQGRYNIPNIGIFFWRLRAYSVTDSPAPKVDDRRYLFSPLGINTQLFTRPETEEDITHLAEPINVPMPISRRVLDENMTDYYGIGKSLLIRREGLEVSVDDVVACDLSDAGGGTWAHQLQGKVAIDPVLGRIAFPQNLPPPNQVQVTFHYGFSADMSGGEYERAATLDLVLQPVETVPVPRVSIQDALDAVQSGGGVVEISDTGRYVETPSIKVGAGQRIELRAANERRPVVLLSGEMQISGGERAEVTLNGLLIKGGAIRIPKNGNKLRRLRFRHCTLVPGIDLDNNGNPTQANLPSLIVELPNVTVEIDHCIMGGLRIVEGANAEITDSIVDATSESGVAYAAPNGRSAGGRLRIVDSTVIGKISTYTMELASNAIFMATLKEGDKWKAPVYSEIRQTGCVRFCYLPENAIVSQRYHCQPNLAIQKAIDVALMKNPELSDDERMLIEEAIQLWLKPVFSDLRYGQPPYGQLSHSCSTEIRTGADDEGEMGVFHKLYQPQRETNLRVRLNEYLRLGLEAGIFFVT